MNDTTKIGYIKETSVFDNLSEKDYQQIAAVSEEEHHKQHSIIFRENEIADAFYIIAEGEVEILKEGRGKLQEILAVKKKSDVFGEMAVIDELPRSATIRAKTDIILLRITKSEFVEMLKSFPHISFEMAKTVCYTVRRTNAHYIRDLEKRNKQLEGAYKRLKMMQNELIHAEKLSVVGKFASLIIHDIRNPLTNIRAYAELINVTCSGNDGKIQKSTQVIMDEVDRLANMTSELLEFSRGEIQLSKTPVDLTAYINTLLDVLKEGMEHKKVSVIFNEYSDCVVLIDPEKMKRVFFNLMSNAQDALISGGNITIKTVEDEKYVKWIIEDNGMGMDKETVEKIFEPFFTKKKKGTGLGMAIVKSIVESHGGIIQVESELDEGTRFTILLPVV